MSESFRTCIHIRDIKITKENVYFVKYKKRNQFQDCTVLHCRSGTVHFWKYIHIMNYYPISTKEKISRS